jgi:hypothetical protein
MGDSTAYIIFSGLAETGATLLLFRRTATADFTGSTNAFQPRGRMGLWPPKVMKTTLWRTHILRAAFTLV